MPWLRLSAHAQSVVPRHASVGKTFGERDDKCPMRAKLSQFGGLSAHKNEETFAQIGLSPVNFVVDARCELGTVDISTSRKILTDYLLR